MVARRKRHHTMGFLFGRQPEHGVEGTACFERSGSLEILGFQTKGSVGHFAECARRKKRCPGKEGGQSIARGVDIIHRGGDRWRVGHSWSLVPLRGGSNLPQ